MTHLLRVANKLDSRYDVRELFDPIQTHAVYGVSVFALDHVKATLKEAGATRFRIIKTTVDNRIVCFKDPEFAKARTKRLLGQ